MSARYINQKLKQTTKKNKKTKKTSKTNNNII